MFQKYDFWAEPRSADVHRCKQTQGTRAWSTGLEFGRPTA